MQGPMILSEYPLNEYVIKNKKTVLIDNTLLDERFEDAVENSKIRSLIGIPLISKRKYYRHDHARQLSNFPLYRTGC